ncbi:MAG: hypothetical protein FJX23_05465 [Alphaproteobacteria bacterium]|nr:hypothetical protein [Alphaproteobacteria bacterium]
MKLFLRLCAFFAALGILALLAVPFVDAQRAVPKEDRRAGLIGLNYYANLRFLLGRVGMGDALKPLQAAAYQTVSGYDDIIGAQAYADYLFYVLPADGQKSLDIRLAQSREVQEKAKDVQQQPLPEGLAAAYYWHLMDDAAKAVLKLAEKEALCSHPYTAVYREIRTAFRANSPHIAQLLVREGKLKAADVKPNAGVRSKVAEQADAFIQSDCAFSAGELPKLPAEAD